MTDAVSRRLLTANARVRAHVSPCRIFGGHSGTTTSFSTRSSAFSCHYHSTVTHCDSPCLYIIWGVNCGPVVGRSQETVSPHQYEQH
jgi:hypothetical protein